MTQFSIGEVAHLVNRKPATVRMWHREGLLPQTLQPTRDERGRRYWTDAQVDEMKKWIVSAKRIPGIGLPGYSPTQEQIQRHLDGQRKPRPAARKDNRYGAAGSNGSSQGGHPSTNGFVADGGERGTDGSDHHAEFHPDRAA